MDSYALVCRLSRWAFFVAGWMSIGSLVRAGWRLYHGAEPLPGMTGSVGLEYLYLVILSWMMIVALLAGVACAGVFLWIRLRTGREKMGGRF